MEFFERFQHLYLWLDSDEVGARSAEKYAKLLGANRTFIIDPRHNFEKPPKDANDALRQGLSFEEILKGSSRWLDQENIVPLDHLKDSVYHRIMNLEQMQGVRS